MGHTSVEVVGEQAVQHTAELSVTERTEATAPEAVATKRTRNTAVTVFNVLYAAAALVYVATLFCFDLENNTVYDKIWTTSMNYWSLFAGATLGHITMSVFLLSMSFGPVGKHHLVLLWAAVVGCICHDLAALNGYWQDGQIELRIAVLSETPVLLWFIFSVYAATKNPPYARHVLPVTECVLPTTSVPEVPPAPAQSA